MKLKKRGFTLVELIIVVVLMGVIALVTLIKRPDHKDEKALSFASQVSSLLRYAHSLSIVKNRTSCIQINNDFIQVKIASNNHLNKIGAPPCDTVILNDPNGLENGVLYIPSGLSISYSGGSEIRFDSNGEVYNQSAKALDFIDDPININIVIEINNTYAITINPNLGTISIN